ncbi:MAG: hypothetical protein RIQ93_1253 [Verrucomicrobiota bacterium]|jgi:hypothetical protein
MSAETDISLVEPIWIRVYFHPADNSVTLIDLAPCDVGELPFEFTLPADYLVRVIAPAVETHSREISNPRCRRALVEPLSIRLNFHPEDNSVTLIDLTSCDVGKPPISFTLPADYLVKTIAPAVEGHLRTIGRPTSIPRNGGAARTQPRISVAPWGELVISSARGDVIFFEKSQIDDLARAVRKCVSFVDGRAAVKKRIAMGCCPEHALPLIPFPGLFTRTAGPFEGGSVLVLKCPLSNCGEGSFAISSSGPFERMPIPKHIIPTVENLLRNGLIQPGVLPAPGEFGGGVGQIEERTE